MVHGKYIMNFPLLLIDKKLLFTYFVKRLSFFSVG